MSTRPVRYRSVTGYAGVTPVPSGACAAALIAPLNRTVSAPATSLTPDRIVRMKPPQSGMERNRGPRRGRAPILRLTSYPGGQIPVGCAAVRYAASYLGGPPLPPCLLYTSP